MALMEIWEIVFGISCEADELGINDIRETQVLSYSCAKHFDFRTSAPSEMRLFQPLRASSTKTRQAALKAANRGSYGYQSASMPVKIWKPLVKKVGTEKLEEL
jgi:hypothetical protein